jgi:hypothetical protein
VSSELFTEIIIAIGTLLFKPRDIALNFHAVKLLAQAKSIQ